MDVQVFRSASAACEVLADRIAAEISRRPELVLALPTGRSPLELYRALVARHRAGALDFSRGRTFNLDEWAHLPASDAGSFRAYMERHLFSHLSRGPAEIGFLDGAAEDFDAECARYEEAIARVGGIELAVLGLGANGHIAFNEPGDALLARTHLTRLTRASREANAGAFGGDATRVPTEALTMGMGTILQAKEIALIAFGAGKADAVRKMREGPVTPQVPASFLQLHPRVSVYLDETAAG